MSLHTTMSTRERKLQAAAICKEIQGPSEDMIDLGRKMNTPKDIMLEELSLSSNRGSRLFKMRQKRSEKYTFENIKNDANLNNGVNGEAPSEDPAEEKGDDSSVAVEEPPTTPPNTPDPRPPPNPESIAPGYGGPLKDVPPEKFNSTAVPKSYHSPWDQAITNDPSLSETPSARLPTPDPKPEGLEFKSFNRVATPFGGFEKASRLTIFKAPEVDLNATDATAKAPEFQDTVTKRPTFNRTALGWVTEGAPLILPIVDLAPLMVPESEDL